MRLPNEKPATAFEQKIEDLLIKTGIDPSEIQFRGDDRYLRIGYWQRLRTPAETAISEFIEEKVVDYDDDCGYLFFYQLKHPKI
jgi:hypothetical protein